MPYIVGIDFDNTIVSYDDVMHSSAIQFGLIDKNVPRSKRNIRDEIRRLPDGEMKWCKLQAVVYGERMDEAKLIDGVKEFFVLSKKMGMQVYIVSHKTQFAAADEKGINLRRLALKWMKAKGFFDQVRLDFSETKVFFESTRQDKVGRIRKLNCTHFIDDLEETFLEKSFPSDTAKILFSSQQDISSPKDVTVMCDWKEIYAYFANNGR